MVANFPRGNGPNRPYIVATNRSNVKVVYFPGMKQPFLSCKRVTQITWVPWGLSWIELRLVNTSCHTGCVPVASASRPHTVQEWPKFVQKVPFTMLTKNQKLFLTPMGETKFFHHILLNFSLGPFIVIEVNFALENLHLT